MFKRLSNVLVPFCAAAGLLFGTCAVADSPTPVDGPEATPLTAADVGAWLDGFMPVALARAGVVGAVVVVVKDGAVLFEKGYGYADVANRTPVDPKTTLFRPASISKLFTWTAVMQLVEQGKLDLDADVNLYLDFKIPPREGKPITLRNIMTHTTGFEEWGRGLMRSKPNPVSLGEMMKSSVPARVFAPGTTPAYSNYGAALAGYIVERVSGEPFEQYIDNHIYKPLGMEHSTFLQPPPERLAPLVSKGYPDVSRPAEPFEYGNVTPAGSMSASGDDMAKFMIAHLQDGRLGEAMILKPETARLMHNSRTAIMAPLNGIELGFIDADINGHRVISHGGDLAYFHSNLSLFIDDHVGLFISMNSAGIPGGSVRQLLFEDFADRYFPATPHDGTVDEKTAAEHAKMASGRYRGARGSYTNFLSMLGLLGQLEIVANPDGTISLPMLKGPGGAPKKYHEIAPFLWREIGGHDRFGAIVEDGRVVRVSSDMASAIMVFDRAPASIAAAWIVPALIASLGVLILTALAWPVGAIVRRRYQVPLPHAGERARATRFARYGVLALLAAVVGWAYLAMTFSAKDGMESLMQKDWLILAVETLTLVATLGSTGAAAYSASVVWKGPSGWFGKLWSMLLTAGCLVILWVAYQGHLMNFAIRY